MHYKFLLVLMLLTPNIVIANDTWEEISAGASKASDKAGELFSKATSRTADQDTRSESDFALNLTWSPMNIPFPSAWGASAYYLPSEEWMIGMDYHQSRVGISLFSFEFGEMTEKNYTMQARRFLTNSFNLLFGYGVRTTNINLAKNYFDLFTHNYSNTVSRFRTQYLRLGMGNQWHFNSRYTLAVDWLTVDVPTTSEVLASAEEYGDTEEDKKDIRDAEDILKYYPGGGAFKLTFGMVF